MSARALLIGGGNMGEAIVGGAIDAGVTVPAEWIVVDRNPDRRAVFERWGVPTEEDARAALESADPEAELWLALKPQGLAEFAASLGGAADGRRVVSVMAGITSDTLRERLGDTVRPVRVMPNTPVRVRMGVSAVALGERATPDDSAFAHRVFGALGEVVELPEDLIDAFTGLAGSGPAYVFLFAEALVKAGVEVGISEADAERIVRALLRGSAELLVTSGRSAGDLRRAVTSPKGTTAAGLAELERLGLGEALEAAVRSARDRGRSLSRGA